MYNYYNIVEKRVRELTDSAVSGEILPPLHAHIGAVQGTLQVCDVRVYILAANITLVPVPDSTAPQLEAQCDPRLVISCADVGSELCPLVSGKKGGLSDEPGFYKVSSIQVFI